jgi:hypothetical protein
MAAYTMGSGKRIDCRWLGPPLYRGKYENIDTTMGHVTAAEVDMITNPLMGTEAQEESVLPPLQGGGKQGKRCQVERRDKPACSRG